MAKKPQIQAQTDKGKRINLPESVNYDKKPPIFSLERVQSGKYCFSALDKDNKAQFAEAIFKRRLLTWSQVKSIDRQGLGFEKIAKNAIRAAISSEA
jgi:hypothetical protein